MKLRLTTLKMLHLLNLFNPPKVAGIFPPILLFCTSRLTDRIIDHKLDRDEYDTLEQSGFCCKSHGSGKRNLLRFLLFEKRLKSPEMALSDNLHFSIKVKNALW